MDISGEVSSGLGRAHIFMAQPHYQEQFKQVLGIGAWPGTLNVDLTGESLVRFAALRNAAGMESKELDERVREEAAELFLRIAYSHYLVPHPDSEVLLANLRSFAGLSRRSLTRAAG